MPELASLVSGTVTGPTDPGWDAARQAWNLAADQHPALVVDAASAQDVAATVAHARAAGLRVAPQSTGHGAMTLGPLDDTILLRTAALNGVRIDPAARTARIEAGATWREVVGPAAEHGLAAMHGSSGTVGAVGYCLGGGLGWLARSEGLAANAIVALDVVTADGEARRVDAEHEPDLFWALRGGGLAGLAVVTAIELRLVELREAFAGQILWPIADAATIVAAYAAFTRTAPETVMSTVKLVRFPPLPDVPEVLRGQAFVAVTLAATGDLAAAEALVAPLREAAPAVVDGLGVVPAAALAEIAGDPPGPLPGMGGDGLLLGALTDEVADAFVELAGPEADVPLILLELRHLGGALARGDAAGGAAGPLDGAFVAYAVGAPFGPEVAQAIGATLDRIAERLAPFATGGTLLAFAERQPGLSPSLPAETIERLAAVKRRYDPDGLLVGNRTIS